MKIHTVVDFGGESREFNLKEAIKSKLQNGKEWVVRNKETIVTYAPIVIPGVLTVCKVVVKNANLRKQETIKNLYCYDRSLGHYWSLRRELTNREWLEIDDRKRNGERLSDILSDMRVLK